MKTSILFVTVFIYNAYQLQCIDNGNSWKAFHIDSSHNQLKLVYEEFDKFPQTIRLISNLSLVRLLTLRFSTVILPLTASLVDDKRYIKALSSTQKVVLTSRDGDLSLNEAEKFLQNFWTQHKTTKIFIMERNVIYFFNPFIYDYDANLFGKLQTEIKWRWQESEKSIPMRIEVFASTYSAPYNWRDFSKGFYGPDIEIGKIIAKKMNFEGEYSYHKRNLIGMLNMSQGIFSQFQTF